MAGKRDGYREVERRLLERELDRARFLRLIGTGATLPLIPASLAALGARSSSAQTPSPEILSAEGEYPIGAWSPPPPRETTTERYAEIFDAGFNFVIGGNGVNRGETQDDPTDLHQRALDAAEANNLRFLITDNILQNAIRGLVSRNPREDVTTRIERLLQRYGSSPALAGISLYDEPKSKLFGILAYAKEELQRLAGQELPYVNIWPSHTSPKALGTRTYGEYLKRYLGTVSPPLLSFDHYPLLARGITPDYFYNWAVIRNRSLLQPPNGIPSWGFIQSVGFDGRRVGLTKRRKPNEDELFWQINVGLAYGAKGLQYFTYWTPLESPIRFGDALLSKDGRRTELYDHAQRANTYLKKVGTELLPLESESVVHAREKRLPRGAKAFRADGYVERVGGSPAILGRFSDPSDSTKQYLLVVNRSLANRSSTVLTMSGAVGGVSRYNTASVTYEPVTLDSARSFRAELGPGRAELYRLSTA